jgi:hypothetical protein
VAGVQSLPLPDPHLAVDDRPVACSSWLAYGGAYQLTLWTIVPELALELHSSYLGHRDGDTATSHLQLLPGEPPLTVTDHRPGSSLPMREARRLCLYDHLASLRDLVAEHTSQAVRIDIPVQALERVDVT